MKKKIKINNKKIFIRNLVLKDCNLSYVKWLNDPYINKWLEVRWKKQNIKSVGQFVKKMNKSNNNYLLGIFLKKEKKHIGNIKIGNIDYNNKSAEIGFFIGEKKYHGMGIASQSIKLISAYCFGSLNLKYLFGQVYEQNIASQKCFLKNKFVKSGYFRNKVVYMNKRTNLIYYEKLYKH